MIQSWALVLWTILVEISIRSWIYKSKIQKNGIGREIEGLEIVSVKMALQTMDMNEIAQGTQGMRRQGARR